jgi:hypothetical protein
VEARKHLDDPIQLQAIADALLVKYTPPTETWTFDILADGDPTVGQIRLGDTARLWFSGHPRIPDGYYDRRIVRLSGSLGEKVTVTCQATGGG